jgi:hypothetical protein
MVNSHSLQSHMSQRLWYREHWNWDYLRATQPKSRLGIPFTTSLGTVQLHYLRSAIFGLGSVKCWVDEEVEKVVVVEGFWKEIYNIGR